MNNITSTIISVLAFLIAIVCHEYAHGYSAYKLGDPTAKNAGRLTFNPLAHIDPIGLVFMIMFRFGWAKGVPINPRYFKDRKRDTLIVSFSGIFTNFIIALLSSILFKISYRLNIYYLQLFFYTLSYVNIMLGVFNLVPIPPLDGSKIVMSLMPAKYEYKIMQYERYFSIILFILVATGMVSRIIVPIINGIMNILY